jgi:hypothetical protein
VVQRVARLVQARRSTIMNPDRKPNVELLPWQVAVLAEEARLAVLPSYAGAPHAPAARPWPEGIPFPADQVVSPEEHAGRRQAVWDRCGEGVIPELREASRDGERKVLVSAWRSDPTLALGDRFGGVVERASFAQVATRKGGRQVGLHWRRVPVAWTCPACSEVRGGRGTGLGEVWGKADVDGALRWVSEDFGYFERDGLVYVVSLWNVGEKVRTKKGARAT